MGCCGQNTTTGAGAAALDTGKRVNYVKGMLLGVDDFVQEQAWHLARRHELAREVLGYGTVRGLKVGIDEHTARVRVTPGMAWTPSGAPVCVGADQCCDINAWIAKNAKAVDQKLEGLAGDPVPLTLYVVLAYAECAVDKVPVPGEPCRSDDDLTVESRIADGFRLELRLDAPAQREEDAIRDFCDWIARVPVDAGSPPQSETDFLAGLRAAATAWLHPSSPPAPPSDYMFGGPPAGMETTDALLRAALRLWVTELRPLWRARHGCGPGAVAAGGPDDAVLLAALDVQLVRSGSPDEVVLDQIVVREDGRPVLLSLRLVQELITQNPAPEPADSVAPALAFGLAPAAGAGVAYARADHQHGTPTLPDLAGDVSGAITRNEVDSLQGQALEARAPKLGDFLVFDKFTGGLRPGLGRRESAWQPRAVTLPVATKIDPTTVKFGDQPVAGNSTEYARADHRHGASALPDTGGDLTGAIDKAIISHLQGQPVKAKEPTEGQVLTFSDGAWRAAAASGGSAVPLIEPVAAGILQLEVRTAGQGGVSVVLASGPTKAALAGIGDTQAELAVDVGAVADADGKRSGFVLKLTPVWHVETPLLAFAGAIKVSSGDSVSFTCMLFSATKLPAGRYRVHFELSRFTPFKE